MNASKTLKELGADVCGCLRVLSTAPTEKLMLACRLYRLLAFKVPAYPADNLPPELAAIPAVKPGSRGLQ